LQLALFFVVSPQQLCSYFIGLITLEVALKMSENFEADCYASLLRFLFCIPNALLNARLSKSLSPNVR
jgi:hypothetical protein